MMNSYSWTVPSGCQETLKHQHLTLWDENMLLCLVSKWIRITKFTACPHCVIKYIKLNHLIRKEQILLARSQQCEWKHSISIIKTSAFNLTCLIKFHWLQSNNEAIASAAVNGTDRKPRPSDYFICQSEQRGEGTGERESEVKRKQKRGGRD